MPENEITEFVPRTLYIIRCKWFVCKISTIKVFVNLILFLFIIYHKYAVNLKCIISVEQKKLFISYNADIKKYYIKLSLILGSNVNISYTWYAQRNKHEWICKYVYAYGINTYTALEKIVLRNNSFTLHFLFVQSWRKLLRAVL